MNVKKMVITTLLLQPLMLLASNTTIETSTVSPQILQKVGAYYKLCLPQNSNKDKEEIRKQILSFTKTTPVDALQLNSVEEISLLSGIGIAGCKKLKKLYLIGADLPTGTWQCMLDNCTELTELWLDSCKNTWWTNWKNQKKLQKLMLSYISLRPKMVQKILNNCKFTELVFGRGINNDPLKKIHTIKNLDWKNQTELKKLVLPGDSLTYTSLFNLLDSCKKLIDLDLTRSIGSLPLELRKHYANATEVRGLRRLIAARIKKAKQLLFAIGNNIIAVENDGKVTVDLTTCSNLPENLRKILYFSFNTEEK